MTATQLGPQPHSYPRLYDQPEPKLKLTPRTMGAFAAVALLYAGGGAMLNLLGMEFTIPPIVEPATVVIDTYDPLPPETPVERPVTATEPIAPTSAPLPPTDIYEPVLDHPVATTADADIPLEPLSSTAGPIIEPATVGPVAALEATPAPPTIRSPAWLARPTAAQLDRLYPRRAADRGISGMVNLECRVTAQGTMSNCLVLDEAPLNLGFGAAALASTRYFKMSPRTVDGAPIEGAKVRIPMGLNIEP